jgi:hypothetical protein
MIAICGKFKARLCGHAVPVMPLLRHQRPSLNGSGDRGRSVAIVIWLLSRNIALAGYYVWSMHPDVFNDEENVPDEPQLALLMLGWWARAKTQRWVRDAVDDPNHKTRVLADEFLIRRRSSPVTCDIGCIVLFLLMCKTSLSNLLTTPRTARTSCGVFVKNGTFALALFIQSVACRETLCADRLALLQQ